MARMPVVSANHLVKVFEKDGFRVIRQRGSHIVLQKKFLHTTVTVVIPNHKEIARGTLRAILKKAGWTSEHLVKLLSVIALAIRYW